MKKIEVNCWEVSCPDGGGMHSEHICYAGSKSVAEAIAADNKSWPRYVNEVKKKFVIVESMDEYRALLTENAREAALAKLTEADKVALGIEKL